MPSRTSATPLVSPAGVAAWCDDDDEYDGPPLGNADDQAERGDDSGLGDSTRPDGLKEEADLASSVGHGSETAGAQGVAAAVTAAAKNVAVFAYGSNMNVAQVMSRVGAISERYLACLARHRLVFNKKTGMRKTGYANVEPATEITATDVLAGAVTPDGDAPCVWGILYVLSPSQVEHMDSFEGAGRGHYERQDKPVDVYLRGYPPSKDGTGILKDVTASVYVACPGSVLPGLVPSESYLSNLLGGRGMLPPKYTAWLQAHPRITMEEMMSS